MIVRNDAFGRLQSARRQWRKKEDRYQVAVCKQDAHSYSKRGQKTNHYSACDQTGPRKTRGRQRRGESREKGVNTVGEEGSCRPFEERQKYGDEYARTRREKDERKKKIVCSRRTRSRMHFARS